METESSELSRSPAPSSRLLQDLLREKKASSRRQSKSHRLELRSASGASTFLDAREVQSSPLGPSGVNSNRRTSGISSRNTSGSKEMGAREMDDYVSKMNKQNFDLKLELFHRRQRAEILEAQVDRMKMLAEENAEMQQTNEALLKELEKRDTAIQEAVDIICDLEEQIQSMADHSLEETRSDSLLDEMGVGRGRGQHLHSSPPVSKTPSHVRGSVKSLRREPSFLRERFPSTSALRSLYNTDEGTESPSTFSMIPPRPMSAFSKDDSGENGNADIYSLKSPSLSVLSESSFLSVYGKAKEQSSAPVATNHIDTLPNGAAMYGTSTFKSSREGTRLKAWLDSRELPSRPVLSSSKSSHGDHISTIGEVLQANFSKRKPARVNVPDRKFEPQQPEQQGQYSIGGSMAGSIFGHHPLPPTPDTLTIANASATSMVESQSSIIAEKSKTDVTPIRKIGPHLRDYESSDEESYFRPQPVVEQVNEPLRHTNSTRKLINTLGLPSEPSAPYGANMMFNGSDYLPAPAISPRRTHRSPIVEAYRRGSAHFASTSASRSAQHTPSLPSKATDEISLRPQDWLAASHCPSPISPTRPHDAESIMTAQISNLSSETSPTPKLSRLPTSLTLVDPLRSHPVTPGIRVRATLASRFFRRSMSSTGTRSTGVANIEAPSADRRPITPVASAATSTTSRATPATFLPTFSRRNSSSQARAVFTPSARPIYSGRPGTAGSLDRDRPRIVHRSTGPVRSSRKPRAMDLGLDGHCSDAEDYAQGKMSHKHATAIASDDEEEAKNPRRRRAGSFGLASVSGKSWGLSMATNWRLGGPLGRKKGE